jgi:hypothetical protein
MGTVHLKDIDNQGGTCSTRDSSSWSSLLLALLAQLPTCDQGCNCVFSSGRQLLAQQTGAGLLLRLFLLLLVLLLLCCCWPCCLLLLKRWEVSYWAAQQADRGWVETLCMLCNTC